ncbi:uncharacterized transporter slc-17.2-like [Sipha flava]|uniref:Uncharacterized transporter slc-17.2-like n=1 Tax=Sipha flava TaxID=143950 RepID=A0A8B8FC16_9HEMI|nr:uncharacterized transporter slc-17.2-like [Sipha flava]
MAITNTVATISGVLNPVVTSYIRKNKDKEEWTMIFSVTSGVFLFGALFYGLFSSGERQPWTSFETVESSTIIIRRSINDTLTT